MGLLQFLNQYSTLILVLVTGAYVILTWRMVNEMKAAREADLRPNLVASLVPLGATAVKVRISNVGPGPALTVHASMALFPPAGTQAQEWLEAGVFSGQHFDFALPGRQTEFNKIVEAHERLDVALSWGSILGRNASAHFTFDLPRLKDGLYKSGQLMPPDELPEALNALRKELSEIAKKIDRLGSRHD